MTAYPPFLLTLLIAQDGAGRVLRMYLVLSVGYMASCCSACRRNLLSGLRADLQLDVDL
jgi:hypothetical protein